MERPLCLTAAPPDQNRPHGSFFCQFAQHIQQHVRTIQEIFLSGELLRIMTDAVYTGDKDHGGRAHQCQILRVLSCTGSNSAARVSMRARRLFNLLHDFFAEEHRLETG